MEGFKRTRAEGVGILMGTKSREHALLWEVDHEVRVCGYPFLNPWRWNHLKDRIC
jgi:hypothetical protein